MKSQMTLNLGHLGSKTMSLGQMKEIPCGGCKDHISCSVDLKIGWNVCYDDTLDQLEFGSPGQIKGIPCRCYSGHISCSFDFNIGQDVCLYGKLDELEFGSPGVIN